MGMIERKKTPNKKKIKVTTFEGLTTYFFIGNFSINSFQIVQIYSLVSWSNYNISRYNITFGIQDSNDIPGRILWTAYLTLIVTDEIDAVVGIVVIV